VEKIYTLTQAMCESTFHIVGMEADDLGWPQIPGNALVHGEVYGRSLESIYRVSDIGIGTLGLHRRSLDETSALKPLEYLMYGLPVILGYRETHEKLRSSPYVLNIGNFEQNVAENIGAIVEFSHAWQNKRVVDDLSYLSSSVIEKARMRFIKQVCSDAAAT
jgi:hypothetical protein